MRLGQTLAAAAAFAISVSAQNAAPRFEVALIKRASLDAPGAAWGLRPGGLFRATGVTVRNLIGSAFVDPGPPRVTFPPDRILGGPAWIGVDRFDIEARTDAAVASARPMLGTPLGSALLQSLLRDRFGLQTHQETRDFPVFVLTVAKRDGALGPKLKRSNVDCQALAQARGRGTGVLTAAPVPGESPCFPKTGRGLVQGVAIPMMPVVGAIRAGLGGAEVVDRTGITGAVDVDLHFSIQPNAGLNADPAAASLPDGESVFTAVQDQLGLKLESHKEPRPVLVIDHVERPTED